MTPAYNTFVISSIVNFVISLCWMDFFSKKKTTSRNYDDLLISQTAVPQVEVVDK